MREVDVKFCWTVDNIPFRPIKEDEENHWFLTTAFERKIDVPAALLRHPVSGADRTTSVLIAESTDAGQVLPLVVGLKSKYSMSASNGTAVKLRVVAPVAPQIAGDFGAPTEQKLNDKDKTCLFTYSVNSPIGLMAEEEKTFHGALSLPDPSKLAPGMRIKMRAEYWHDGVLAEYGYVPRALPASAGSPTMLALRDFTTTTRYHSLSPSPPH
jgi:hypothetical protein